jgi:hypothetical protein
MIVDGTPTIGKLLLMMATATTEPRVIADGLVFHWRSGAAATPFCGAAPVVGSLMPASQAPDRGLAECPDCDRALRATGWRKR